MSGPDLVSPSESIQSIMTPLAPLPTNILAEEVNDVFKKRPGITSIPVVDGKTPVGIVSRSTIIEAFSGRYSHALHTGKPISKYLETPLIVDCNTPIQQVSELITQGDGYDLNLDFIITRDGEYQGVGKVSALLREVTDLQIRSARYSNPLTQLPGNVPIYEWLDELLAARENFYVAYLDINHFKPYNDHYGYSRGDEVISLLANVIKTNIAYGRDWVGHIGGDDFVVIFRTEDWAEKCNRILEEFASCCENFYAASDLDAGYILSADRQGIEVRYPLISLAIGGS